MSIQRKSVTKSDIVREIKAQGNTITSMYQHMMFIDDILAKFVNFLEKEDEFAEYLTKIEEDGKSKQQEREQGRGNSATSE